VLLEDQFSLRHGKYKCEFSTSYGESISSCIFMKENGEIGEEAYKRLKSNKADLLKVIAMSELAKRELSNAPKKR